MHQVPKTSSVASLTKASAVIPTKVSAVNHTRVSVVKHTRDSEISASTTPDLNLTAKCQSFITIQNRTKLTAQLLVFRDSNRHLIPATRLRPTNSLTHTDPHLLLTASQSIPMPLLSLSINLNNTHTPLIMLHPLLQALQVHQLHLITVSANSHQQSSSHKQFPFPPNLHQKFQITLKALKD